MNTLNSRESFYQGSSSPNDTGLNLILSLNLSLILNLNPCKIPV